jgi:hypothetical protein
MGSRKEGRLMAKTAIRERDLPEIQPLRDTLRDLGYRADSMYKTELAYQYAMRAVQELRTAFRTEYDSLQEEGMTDNEGRQIVGALLKEDQDNLLGIL